ncbi:hypothetical protein OG871_01290 [Kitasatospora sp. NBC_00374]|uniref:hypothetical protein n=1 Tax=Kitasatospora sp. NBC_00374 TaxID=2975964 RepID=UPI003254ECB2
MDDGRVEVVVAELAELAERLGRGRKHRALRQRLPQAGAPGVQRLDRLPVADGS